MISPNEYTLKIHHDGGFSHWCARKTKQTPDNNNRAHFFIYFIFSHQERRQVTNRFLAPPSLACGPASRIYEAETWAVPHPRNRTGLLTAASSNYGAQGTLYKHRCVWRQRLRKSWAPWPAATMPGGTRMRESRKSLQQVGPWANSRVHATPPNQRCERMYPLSGSCELLKTCPW